MKSTHWSVQDDPEQWNDNPLPSPIEAVREYLTGEYASDDAWDDRDQIMDGETVTITAHGWIQTDAPLDPEVAFDGYEPGQSYYAPTKETTQVRVCLSYADEVQP